MTKLALIFALIVFPEVVLSQSGGTMSPSGEAIKIVRVRYGNAHTLAGLVHINGVNIDADNAMQVMVLKGDRTQVAAMEQIIRELDVPPTAPPSSKDVEVTVSVIGGSSSGETAPAVQVSEDMAPVVKQLRAIFPYKNYQVLSSMLLRSGEGSRALNSGVMKGPSSLGKYSYPPLYTVQYDGVKSSVEGGKVIIHLANFKCSMRLPVQTGALDKAPPDFERFGVDVVTDVDLREGQRVVVGKANAENSDSAIFVVLTARLVD